MQRHSGNVLPPPVDDYMNHSSGKPIAKNASSNSSSIIKSSPPNGSSGRSIVLPAAAAAAWGSRATGCQPRAGGLFCPDGPTKPKPDTVSSTLAFSSAVAGTIQASTLHGDMTKRPKSSDGNHIMPPRVQNELLNPVKQHNSMDNLCNAGEKTATSNVSLAPVNLSSQLSSQPLSRDSDGGSCATANATNSTDVTRQLCRSGPEEAITATTEEIQNLCSDLSSTNIDRFVQNEHYGVIKPSSTPSDLTIIKSSLIQESPNKADKFVGALITTLASKTATSDNGVSIAREQCDWRLDSQSHLVSDTTEVEDDITSFDNQRLKDPEVCRPPYLFKSASFVNVSNHSSPHLLQHGEPGTAINGSSLSAADKIGEDSLLHASSILCNGYPDKLVGGSSYCLNSTVERSLLRQHERNEPCIGTFPGEAVNVKSDADMDKGESSIISNILSMDFDPWDDSLTSPQNLAKLLGDNTDNQCDRLKKTNSWKVQNNNQSRFSFARQEESRIRTFDALPSYGVGEQPKSCTVIQDFAERDLYLSKLGIGHGFPTSNSEESKNLGTGHVASSNKLSAVSRAQITAPPGFSVPSRAPPPGFSSHERVEQAFDSISGNSLLESSSLLRSSYQMPTSGYIGSAGDVEFNDPAILAVGKGRLEGVLNSPELDMRSNFAPQLNYFENEARLQLLMQQSLSQQQQNLRFSELGNSFSQLSDSYGLSSRLDQSQVSNLVPFPQLSLQQSRNAVLSNGMWNGWNEVQRGNSLGVAELLRNERLGLNKFYAGYEDPKYRMQNSGDIYNRTYGM